MASSKHIISSVSKLHKELGMINPGLIFEHFDVGKSSSYNWYNIYINSLSDLPVSPTYVLEENLIASISSQLHESVTNHLLQIDLMHQNKIETLKAEINTLKNCKSADARKTENLPKQKEEEDTSENEFDALIQAYNKLKEDYAKLEYKNLTLTTQCEEQDKLIATLQSISVSD